MRGIKSIGVIVCLTVCAVTAAASAQQAWQGGPARDLNGDGIRDLVWFRPNASATDPTSEIAIVDAATGDDIARFAATDGPGVLAALARRSPLDLNDDQVVNTADLVLLLRRVGTQGQPRMPGDINADGVVDQHDVALLLGGIEALRGPGWIDALASLAATSPEAAQALAGPLASRSRAAAGAPRGLGDCIEFEGEFLCGGGDDGPGGGSTGTGVGGGSGNSGGGGFLPPGGGPGLPSSGAGGGGQSNCECDTSIEITGPDYIGIFDSASLGVRFRDPHSPGCGWYLDCNGVVRGPVRGRGWYVSSGAGIVLTPSSPWYISSNGTPGSVTIGFELILGDGTTFAATKTVTIKDYPPVSIRYMAFIECQVVPGFEILGYGAVWGEGDNRGFRPGATSWRARIDHSFRAGDVSATATTSALTVNPPVFGDSRLYTPFDITTPANSAWPFACDATTSGLPLWARTLPLRPEWADFQMRRRAQSSTVDTMVKVRAENPFSQPASFILGWVGIGSPTPPIQAYLALTFEYTTNSNTGVQEVVMSLSDSHSPFSVVYFGNPPALVAVQTLFPAHELYVQGRSVNEFMYSHTAAGTRVADLGFVGFVSFSPQRFTLP